MSRWTGEQCRYHNRKNVIDGVEGRFDYAVHGFRRYSSSADSSSRFPQLENIFLQSSSARPPVYSQFTTPRWKRWHEFTVQFSIPPLFSPPRSGLAPSPFAHPPQPSVRHSPLFTTSKRRTRSFPLGCARKIRPRRPPDANPPRFLLLMNDEPTNLCILGIRECEVQSISIHRDRSTGIRGISPLCCSSLRPVALKRCFSRCSPPVRSSVHNSREYRLF